MASHSLLFSAVSSSTRHILLLLRCISFAKKAQVRISSEGLRFSTAEGSAMEAFVFLDKSLFTSYSYHALPPSSAPHDNHEPPETPSFEIDLASLLETLNIFSLSDPSALKRGNDLDAFAAHRLHRHAGLNTFSNPTLGVTGVCTFSHDGPGTPLSIHLSEAGVTTSCDLTTYTTNDDGDGDGDDGHRSREEIPFDRERLALKAILRSGYLLDAFAELSTLSPAEMTISAVPSSAAAPSSTPNPNGGGTATSGANLSLSASGTLGSVNVDFTTRTSSDTPVLETFLCPAPVRASFKFGLIKAAQRAMAAASKVSVRLDEEGVLSLQFLIEVDAASVAAGGEGIAFVDFRMVPLLDGEEGEETEEEAGEE